MTIIIEIEKGIVIKNPVSNGKGVEIIIIDHDTEKTSVHEAEPMGTKGLRQYLNELNKPDYRP